MGPLIDAKLEEIDRKHAALTGANRHLNEALNLYRQLMKESCTNPAYSMAGPMPGAMNQLPVASAAPGVMNVPGQQPLPGGQYYNPYNQPHNMSMPPTSVNNQPPQPHNPQPPNATPVSSAYGPTPGYPPAGYMMPPYSSPHHQPNPQVPYSPMHQPPPINTSMGPVSGQGSSLNQQPNYAYPPAHPPSFPATDHPAPHMHQQAPQQMAYGMPTISSPQMTPMGTSAPTYHNAAQ